MKNGTTLEFAVYMTCSNCEKKLASVLEQGGITDYKIYIGNQRVIAVTDKPSEAVKNNVETTGKLC